jgi:hypothetical protein
MSKPDPAPARPERRGLEVLIVVLLGIVGIATAYTSFQANLYGNASGDRMSRSEIAATLGESLFQEGDAQLQRDLQTLVELAQLEAAIAAGAPYAQAEYDARYAYAVAGYPLEAAVQRAEEYDGTQEGVDGNPVNDEAYREELFGDYTIKSTEALDLADEARALGTQGDQLGLYTAIMAITLFLLGVAAVVKRTALRWVLVAFGLVIFGITVAGVAAIPFVWIGF